MKQHIISLILGTALLAGCANFLEPLPNGSYNEKNYADYPALVRGYVEKAYDLRPGGYISSEYLGGDGLADNVTFRNQTENLYRFATGSAQMNGYNFSSLYTRDYSAIYYCNLFLKDDLGLKTRYLINEEANTKLQRCLQGDAYALRA